eukprot:4270755-Amphidinium_carterae.1
MGSWANTEAIRVLNGLGSVFRSHRYIMPVPAFNVINGGSHAGHCNVTEKVLLELKAIPVCV